MITNWSKQMSDALVTVILIQLRVGSWRSWGEDPGHFLRSLNTSNMSYTVCV